MMLIETEFKDASVEERKQWFEELRQVPPEMVPRILRMRRLTQQAIQGNPTRGRPPGPGTTVQLESGGHDFIHCEFCRRARFVG